jgi:hypothetical protein
MYLHVIFKNLMHIVNSVGKMNTEHIYTKVSFVLTIFHIAINYEVWLLLFIQWK